MSERVSAADVARAARRALEGGPAAAAATVVESEQPDAVPLGARILVLEDGTRRGRIGSPELDDAVARLALRALPAATTFTDTVEVAGHRCTLFVESYRAADSLVVVGAGHIAVPLAHMAALAGFRVTVLDDREDFADAGRFPDAAAVLRADFADPFRDVTIGGRTWIVLVTRAHRYDFDCLRRLLDADPLPRYIGMIGSRRRVRAALGALLDAGIPAERLTRVSAPVGLDIGAETPEEIAVSIVAELIEVRRAAVSGARLAAKEKVVERLLRRADVDSERDENA